MTYLIFFSNSNVLTVKGGGDAWTILKIQEKFYKNPDNKMKVASIFADYVIVNKDDFRYVDECMDKKTEEFFKEGKLPFRRGTVASSIKKIVEPWQLVYKHLAPAYYFWALIKRNIKSRKNLFNYTKQINFTTTDIVILDCHDAFAAYFASSIKFPCKKILVVHSHEIGSQALNMLKIRNGKNFLIEKVALFMEKIGYEKSDYISFPGKGAMNTLLTDRKDLKRLLDKKEIKILYTGIEVPFKKSIGTENLKISNNLPIKLLFVGRLVEDKGFDLVLEAVKILNDQGYNFALSIVGWGDADKIKKYLNENNLNDKVFLLGALPHENVLKLMEEHDILVAPHRRSVFDLVMLEAMHIGLPIISTAVGGNIELITSENQGILVEPNNVDKLVDATKLLIDNQSLRSSLAANARQYAEEFFSEEAMFERYKNFFEEIIKK